MRVIPLNSSPDTSPEVENRKQVGACIAMTALFANYLVPFGLMAWAPSDSLPSHIGQVWAISNIVVSGVGLLISEMVFCCCLCCCPEKLYSNKEEIQKLNYGAIKV